MPAFVITSKPHRPGQTVNAVLCDPNVAGHPDRSTDVPIKALIGDQTLTIDDEPRPRSIISSVGQNGTRTFLVGGSTNGLRNKERHARLEKASTLLRDLTETLRPLWGTEHSTKRLKLLGSYSSGFLKSVIASRRQRRPRDMLDRSNGHTEPVTRATVARLERQLKNVVEAGEQRASILRDATAEYLAAELASRDKRITKLETQVAELANKLDQKMSVDQQVHEIAKHLDARQAARDEGRRGLTGHQGERGARGEMGPPGPRGPAGRPADPTPKIYSWLLDREKFQVTPYLNDGTSLPTLDLRPLFESYFHQTN